MKRDEFTMPLGFAYEAQSNPHGLFAKPCKRLSHQPLTSLFGRGFQPFDRAFVKDCFRASMLGLVRKGQVMSGRHHLACVDLFEGMVNFCGVPWIHHRARYAFKVAINHGQQREKLILRWQGFKFFSGQRAIGNSSGHLVLHVGGQV